MNDDEEPVLTMTWNVGLKIMDPRPMSGRNLIAEGLRRKEYQKSYDGYDTYNDAEYDTYNDMWSKGEVRKRQQAIEEAQRLEREARAAKEAAARARLEEKRRVALEKQKEAEAHYRANPVYGSL